MQKDSFLHYKHVFLLFVHDWSIAGQEETEQEKQIRTILGRESG